MNKKSFERSETTGDRAVDVSVQETDRSRLRDLS